MSARLTCTPTYSSDSPFSPTSFSPTTTSNFPWASDQQLTQSIDDIIYRYSAEQDRGTPTVGIYAQDGLWDDDELSSEATTLRRGSGSTFGHSSTKNAKGEASRSNRTSVKARSRSGTVGSAIVKEDRSMWSWNKKPAGMSSPLDRSPVAVDKFVQPSVPVVPPQKTLEKKKSKSLLRGKGRRGELSVNVSPSEPPPLPPTPASYLTNTPGLSTASTLSPVSHLNSSTVGTDFSPAFTPNSANDKSAKSSWRRGMQKIFKSKSSMALREAFSSMDPNQPPVPNLPRPQNKLGKPFSSSAPPAGTLPKRDTVWSIYDSPLSPPPVLGEPFRLSSHPSLPADPFASSLSSPSNNLPSSIPSSPLVSTKPRLSRNSPSLRDLKQFLAPKPKLTKAKSLANIREKDLVIPASAPPIKTEFSPIEPPAGKLPKRVASVILPRNRRSVSEEPIKTPVLARPILSRIPTESPPLLPPNPPYFPALSALPSKSASSPSTPSTLSIDISSKAPSSPLPALPSSTSLSPVMSTPIKRSGSGAVLLPRSRSTSMSLKAPPTSSSFFDLYEQLGIWPTPSDKETPAEKPSVVPPEKLEPFEKVDVENIPPERTISESPSATFSADSWEAAISAFPLIDDIPIPPPKELDFGVPHMSDVEPTSSWTPDVDLEGEYLDAEASFTSNIAVGGSTCSTSHYSTSNRTSHTVQPTASSSNQPPATRLTYPNGLRRTSRGGGGSNASSGPPSRDERRKNSDGAWFHGVSGESSGSSSEEEDDRPLSQLHPDAAVVQQQEAAKRRATRKAAKVRAKGRNPGGDVAWDGEGGIPADVLTRRLESVMLNKQERLYNWQVAQLAATGRRIAQSTAPTVGSLRPMRSFTAPTTSDLPVGSSSMNRSQTVKRDGRPTLPPIPSPVETRFRTSPVVPHTAAFPDRQGSSRRPDLPPPPSHMLSAGRSAGSTRPSSSSSSQQYTQPSSSQIPPVPNVTRSKTAATSRSSGSRTRSRAISNAASTVKPEEKPHARSTTEPLPQRIQQAVRANVFVGGLNGTRIVLDLYPQTTARDALAGSHSRGELPELALGLNWVVTEVFAELGFERPVREYECLQNIVRGWDPVNRFNCFVFKQSNNAPSTWTRGIPTNAPFLGAYVQYESKKGKWSKRFLETRGGQVFLSKNDKNKEEVQINTLLHDVYTTTRNFDSPKPFVFVMKRVEAASSFENPRDLMHIFCAEESIAWKLVAAVYDAKSHAIAQAQPQLLLGAQIQRRSTAKKDGPAPLVELKEAREKPVEKMGFTGKGLLRI